MNFQQQIATLNARGYSFHVFQEYGPHGEERGHSMSFTDAAAAHRHAETVPGGTVYDALGN